MKKFLLTVLAMGCMVAVHAQNELVTAVLQTGDQVSVYNGVNAFISAYNEATDGSTITLSNGTFSTPGTIRKSVNVFGSGFETIAEEGVLTTIISGDLKYASGSDETSLHDVKLEGVYVNGGLSVAQTSNMIVSKCGMNGFAVGGNNLKGVSVRQCYINGAINGSAFVAGLDFQNCFIRSKMNYLNDDAMLLFNHCIIQSDQDYSHAKATYMNCIIGAGYRVNINSGSTVKHCIMEIGENGGNINEGNWPSTSMSTLFTDATNLYYGADRTFTLAQPELYVGTDGTEVGIRGGSYPWNKVPTSPVVKNLELEVNGATLNVTFDAQVR